ncbi:MAG: hypothetical protein EU540_01595 [Promethearchaeota archaeon]|nr:MAG: hypothetical protein EU540_01595 [Candidatus Lokiarchaeota archaeon]
MKNGDNLRDVSPLVDKTWIDENGYTHYVFGKIMFNNPFYTIPDDEFDLFKKFVEGGSREYPSDGSIPCDIVAGEARKILNQIKKLSNDPNSSHYEEAKEVLKDGKIALLRGTLKLYLGKYTTRDWRRKRFTDDIDFWVFKIHVLHHALKELGWIKNKLTKEWEKKIKWKHPYSNEMKSAVLTAANDLDQLLDFGAGSYLEGTSLRNIFNKKLKRGHDVDLSDIINIVMVNNGINGSHNEEWLDAWNSFEEAANTRSTRTTSNIISLCRYMFAIADHIDKISEAIIKYNDSIFDKSLYPDDEIRKICRSSIHWIDFYNSNGAESTRNMLHDFYHEEAEEKPQHAKNQRDFAIKLLDLLNSKYKHLKTIFEIEN